jgi:TP901 family phage tail tape measure protein
MPNYTTHYVLEFRVRGDEALQDLDKLQKQMQAQMGTVTLGGVQVAPRYVDALQDTYRAQAQWVQNMERQFTRAEEQAIASAETLEAQVERIARAMEQATTAGSAPTTGSASGLRQQISGMEEFARAIDAAQREFGAMRRIGYEMQRAGVLLTGMATGAGYAIYGMAQQYLELEEASTRAGMAMELNVRQFDALDAAIMRASEDVGAFSGPELAEGLRLWAAGTGETVETMEQVQRVLNDTVAIQKVAAMNNVNLSTTTETVGATMHAYGLEIDRVNDVAAVFNYVAAKTFGNVDDIGQAFRMVGPVARQMGITFEETATALALLSDQNIKGTMAGRAMRQMFIQMQRPSKAYNEVMNEMLGLSRDMGEAWREVVFPQGEFMGLPEYIGLLAEKLQAVSGAERSRRLAMLSTANELPALTALVNEQIQVHDEGINVMRVFEKTMTGTIDAEVMAYKRWYEATTGLPYSLEGALARMTGDWEKFIQSDTYRVQKFQRQWETAVQRVGGAFLEDLLPKVESVMNRVTQLSEMLEENEWLRGAITGGIETLAVGGVGAGLLGTLTQQLANIAIIKTAIQSGTMGAGTMDVLGAAGMVGGLLLAGNLLREAGIALKTAAEKQERAAEERALERTPPEQEEQFRQHFARSPIGGAGFVPQTEEAREVVTGTWNIEVPSTQYAPPSSFWTAAALFLKDAAASILHPPQQTEPGMVTDPAALLGMRLPMVKGPEQVTRALHLLVEAINGVSAHLQELRFDKLTRMEARLAPQLPREPYATPTMPVGLTEEQLDFGKAYAEYLESRERTERQFARRREDMVEAFADWEEKAQRDLGRRLAELDEDMAKDRLERANATQERLAKLQQDYYRDQERAAQQHQKSLERMQVDHRDRLIDLLEAGDVRGITKEMRSYRKSRERAVEDYQIQSRQREEDYNRRRAEEEARAQEEAHKQQERLEERRQEMLEAFALERQDRQEALAEQLADLDTAHAEEMKLLDDQAREELALLAGLEAEIDKFYAGMYEKGVEWLGDMEALREEFILGWIQALGMGEDPFEELRLQESFASEEDRRAMGSRQYGGPIPTTGLYQLHAGEYVLDADTTRMLESYHGSLTQSSFQRSEGLHLTYAPVFQGMGKEDRSWYLAAAREQAQQMLAEYTRVSRRAYAEL